MNKGWRCIYLLFLMMALISCASAVKKFTPESDFIFFGTIVVVNSSTINLEDVERTAVVKVDKIVNAEPNYEHLTDQLITVELRKPRYAQTGQQRLFFTRSWHFGKSVGVVEVGSRERDIAEIDKLRKKIGVVRMEQNESEILELIDASPLIISGKVVAVEKAEDTPSGLSEHNPDWHVAEIKVANTLKGKSDGATVKILFANSVDVQWFKSPKYRKDMEGVWLLQKFVVAGRPLKHLTTISPKQFRSREEEPRLKTMIKR